MPWPGKLCDYTRHLLNPSHFETRHTPKTQRTVFTRGTPAPHRAISASAIETRPTQSHLKVTPKNIAKTQIIAPPPIFAMSAYIITSMAQKDSTKDGGGNTSVITRTEPKTKKPSLYKVLLLNDDYTPMEFVVHVLQTFFAKSAEEATRVMLHVHQKGVGICGVYTFEIAETKVTQVMDFAKKHQQPLQCTMEKE